jgi:hypothetical protein
MSFAVCNRKREEVPSIIRVYYSHTSRKLEGLLADAGGPKMAKH